MGNQGLWSSFPRTVYMRKLLLKFAKTQNISPFKLLANQYTKTKRFQSAFSPSYSCHILVNCKPSDYIVNVLL